MNYKAKRLKNTNMNLMSNDTLNHWTIIKTYTLIHMHVCVCMSGERSFYFTRLRSPFNAEFVLVLCCLEQKKGNKLNKQILASTGPWKTTTATTYQIVQCFSKNKLKKQVFFIIIIDEFSKNLRNIKRCPGWHSSVV